MTYQEYLLLAVAWVLFTLLIAGRRQRKDRSLINEYEANIFTLEARIRNLQAKLAFYDEKAGRGEVVDRPHDGNTDKTFIREKK